MPVRYNHYVLRAKALGQPLTLFYEGEPDASMTIPHAELESRITFRGAEPVKDIWHKEKDYLVYYKWKPDVKPAGKLL